jgi:hypothetical protein
MNKNVEQMDSNALLKELEKDLLPKLPSVEGGWRLMLDVFGQQVLAQVSTRLIHLVLKQQSRIDQLEKEIAELRGQITREGK